MNIHHISFILQGWMALYFVAVMVPSVGIDVYDVPSTSIPTLPIVSSTSTSPTTLLPYKLLIHNHDQNNISTSPVHADDNNMSPGIISSIHTARSHPPESIAPASVERDRRGVSIHSDAFKKQNFFNILPELPRSTAFGSSICLLVLGVVLGAVCTCRLIRPSTLQYKPNGNTNNIDVVSPEWRHPVLPVSTVETACNRGSAKPVSHSHLFGILNESRENSLTPDCDFSSRLLTAPSRRTNLRRVFILWLASKNSNGYWNRMRQAAASVSSGLKKGPGQVTIQQK